ncbi:unnamed protein product [Rotaria sp. Silwood1]|nr:unnamed protein product [Rotaria sp. Silwood1]CAF4715244.1 unnamed protein product [Rotaria sp. Silwood1]
MKKLSVILALIFIPLCFTAAHASDSLKTQTKVVTKIAKDTPSPWGISFAYSENGFGPSINYYKKLNNNTQLITGLAIMSCSDSREFDQYDVFGNKVTLNKENRIFLLPLSIGIKKQIFGDDIGGSIKPIVNFGISPSLVLTDPYSREYFNALGYMQAAFAMGGYVGAGLEFSETQSVAFSFNINYSYVTPIAIAGSFRENSYNKIALKYMAQGAKDAGADVEIIDLRDYPMPIYDADIDNAGKPENVEKLKHKLSEAQGLLICTPEYNHSLPGGFKNVIDWLSRYKDQPFKGKWIALAGASISAWGTVRAQLAFLPVFRVLAANILPTQVYIPYKIPLEKINSFGYRAHTTMGDRILTGSAIGLGCGAFIGGIGANLLGPESHPFDGGKVVAGALGGAVFGGLVGGTVGAITGIGATEYEVTKISKLSVLAKYNTINKLIDSGGLIGAGGGALLGYLATGLGAGAHGSKEENFDIMAEAEKYIDAEKGVNTIEEALQGARDIMAEWISENQEAREKMRDLYQKKGVFISKVVSGKEEEGIKYKDYYEWREPISSAPSHRILAMRRGENEGFLSLKAEPETDAAVDLLQSVFVKGNNEAAAQVKLAVDDSYKRLLGPSMETEARVMSKETADKEAIVVEDSLQLLSRYWLIINADGDENEVKGEGVVGQFPYLKPGQNFEYSSFTPLDTEWGTMEGHYIFEKDNGEKVEAQIGRFYLTSDILV